MTSDRDFFARKSSEYGSLIGQKEKSSRLMSAERLVLFIIAAVSAVVGLKDDKPVILTVGIIFFVLFVALCFMHSNIKKEIRRAKALKDAADLYLSRIDGKFEDLKITGEEYLDIRDDYSFDLDIFGKRSVYSLYVVSESKGGRKRFADELSGKITDIDIKSRHEAVKELIEKKELLLEYQAQGKIGKLDKPLTAIDNMCSEGRPLSSFARMLIFIMPLFWLIPVASVFLFPKYKLLSVLSVLIIHLIVWFFISSRYANGFSGVDRLSRQTEAVFRQFLLIEKADLTAPGLRRLVKGGASSDKKASDAFSSLSFTCGVASLRSQPLFALILNSVFPFDLLSYSLLSGWTEKYGNEARKSLDSLYEFEAVMCCTSPSLISSVSTFPEVTDRTDDPSANAFFEGKDILHPLLDPSKAVSNSVTLHNDIALITGSNMSGKTTLIRTVGICAVLSYIGAPVPASELRLGKMRVISSMRIVDDLGEEMSTFKAELIRISKIVDASREGRPLLFLIDEIFRGTNSADRTEGALVVLQNLYKPYITGMMTTHDYALCDKVESRIDKIVYYHFSEKYNDTGISFDYKLHPGVSHESNAAFLMKLVGIT
ncbi:MAG: hypothetical protein IKN14_07945 [Clostridiales bacterium]|nr:hypothetical protein [Clostridiales bacterium]